MLQKGIIVRPDPNHRNYEDYLNYGQYHEDETGIIDGKSVVEQGEQWWRVKWENGHTNSYPESMLIPLDTEQKSAWDEVQRLKNDPVAIAKKREEENKMYELPFLPGTRVCLNPEGDNFRTLNRISNGSAAVVLHIEMDNERLSAWSQLDRRKDVKLFVRFDNEYEKLCTHKDFLQVDTKPKTITTFIFEDGSVYHIIDEDENMLNEINKKAIVYGHKLEEKIVYDNEWRADMVQKIMSYSPVNTSTESKSTKALVDAFEDVDW